MGGGVSKIVKKKLWRHINGRPLTRSCEIEYEVFNASSGQWQDGEINQKLLASYVYVFLIEFCQKQTN